MEVERAEVFRIIKFYENLPRFNRNGKLFWFAFLNYEWFRYDTLPVAAVLLMTFTACVFSFLATAITNLIIEPSPFEMGMFHYMYTEGTQMELSFLLPEHYYGNGEEWQPFNKSRSLFYYLFGIKNYTDPNLLYVPVSNFLSVEGESFMLSWIHSVFGLGRFFVLVSFAAGALPTMVFLDALLSAVFKATRKLAILHKKLRVL